MTGQYRGPRLLDPADGLEEFECRSDEQTDWLRRHARQAHAAGTCKVFVITGLHSREVVAYYAWCMASLEFERAPLRLRKGSGNYSQPVALLARLGTSIDHERRGLGKTMLRDVIGRTARIGSEIGCRGLLIHAETAEARDFYLRVMSRFDQSPTDELHLILLMKDIVKSLNR